MRIGLVFPALLMAFMSAANAQEQSANGRTVYAAAYFSQYSPSSALEIVRRVPGFTLDLGSQEVRGFGQAAGNVVINGSRPSSKSDTLETILARIPASRVLRVETGPGDLFGSEFSGKPQVLNLVLTSEGGLAGTIDVTLQRNFTGAISPDGDVSALYRRGRSSFNLSAGFGNRHSPEEGSDTLYSLPARTVLEFRRKHNDTSDREAFLSGSWEHNGGDNRTAHLNFRVAREHFQLGQTNDVFPASGPIRDDRLSQDEKKRDFEIGGDVTRPFLGGGLKLIGLATRRHRNNHDISLNRIQSNVTGGFEQDVDSQRNETVLRLVYSNSDVGGWSFESGAEGVLNSLDSDVNLYLLDAGGSRTRIDLPVDQAKVTEWRGEAFVNAGRALSPQLRMDLGLTYEASRLTVRGDTNAERTLRFLKPKAVFDWKPGDGWHGQLSLSRTVAQLDFEDFISAAELTDDRVDAGNAELVPQRAWETLLMVERPILGDGLAKLELAYNHISLLQDRVPTPEGFDAPGNIGTGRQMFVRGTLAAPLSRFGIKGGRLDLKGSIQETSVTDPYTGEKRRFSGFQKWSFEGSFRQDLGKFAWILEVYTSPGVSYFRRDEIDTMNSQEPWVNLFTEFRVTSKTTITLGLANVLQVKGERFRTFFKPDRSNRVPWLFEHRERSSHMTSILQLKHSFE